MTYQNVHTSLAKRISILFWVVGLMWVATATVEAHRINIFAWVEGDTVHVESKFSAGKRVQAGKIIVSDAAGTELLTGLTDENGAFSFRVPKKTELKIVIEAGTGHRAQWTVEAAEIEMPVSEKKPAADKSIPVSKILIGIGFIFGLSAIVAYVRKRRKKDRG